MTHIETSLAGTLAALQATVSDAYRDVPARPGARLQPPDALVPQSIPSELNALSLEQAYRLQAGVVRALMATWAAHHVGFKLSCTGAADRALIGADEPTYGMLTNLHLLDSGSRIDLRGTNNPMVEPELLLRLTREPAPDASREELADSVEVTAGLGIPICRFRDWWPEGAMPNLTLGGLVGDNSVAGFVVAGQNWTRLSASEIDSMTVELRTPDGQSARGRAGNVFGSPLAALSWLLGATRRHGVPVPSGAVVASGTFTSPVRARRGTYVADYSMAGAVSVTFEDNGFDKEQSDHGA